MNTKTFRAPNMLTALQDIQREFGPDALVLSMRELPPGPAWQVWRKAGCEVIAMRQPGKSAAAAPVPVAPTAQVAEPTPFAPPAFDRAGSLPGSSLPVSQPSPVDLAFPPAEKRAAQTVEMPPALLGLQRRLLAQGVEETRVRQAVDACLQVIAPLSLKDETRLGMYLRRYLEAGVKTLTHPALTPPNRIMCLVGMSGSGKTSVCAKLASFYAITLEKKVVWICADTVRTGAISEARTYADTLGIELHLVYTPDEMSAAVAAHPEADLILIDTPGCNPFQEDRVVELASFLTRAPGRAIFLVAAATTKEGDLRQAIASFGPLNLKGLIFTKTDETSTLGSIYNLACRSQAPIAFFTTGDAVVGNLRIAEPSDLVDALFRGRF